MSMVKCYYSECQIDPEFICECTKPESLICLSHLECHLEDAERVHIYHHSSEFKTLDVYRMALNHLMIKEGELEDIHSELLKSLKDEIFWTKSKLKCTSGDISETRKLMRDIIMPENRSSDISKALNFSPEYAIRYVDSITSHYSKDPRAESPKFFQSMAYQTKLIEKENSNPRIFEMQHVSSISISISQNQKYSENKYAGLPFLIWIALFISLYLNYRFIWVADDTQWTAPRFIKKENSDLENLISSQCITVDERIDSPILLTPPASQEPKKNSPQNSQSKHIAHADQYRYLFDNEHIPYIIPKYGDNYSVIKVKILDNPVETERVGGTIYEGYLSSEKATMCQLPYNETFCYGNYHGGYSGISFVINKAYNGIRRLTEGPEKTGGGSIYFNESVYIFGGYRYNSLTSAQRYNLNTDKWAQIKELPEASDYVSCALFNELILISGYSHNFLYIYNPKDNSYKESANLYLAKSIGKLVFVARGFAYVVEIGRLIYKSDLEDLTKWKIVGTNDLLGTYLISYQIFKDPYLYFMLNSSILYRFNIDTNKIEQIQ